jgi:aflatoxin B1 aldehyde reductase
MSGIKVVLGGGTIQTGRAFSTPESIGAVLSTLETAGVNTIDTAQIYGESEALLGEAKAGERFTFDTKAPGGFIKGSLTNEGVKQSAATSLKRLGVDKVITSN